VIAYRDAGAADARFVAKSWVASYRDADTAGFVLVENWYDVMIPQVTQAMARPDVRTVLAYETTNPDPGTNAYGFIVADTVEQPPLVYYVFVKAPYRRSGIARGLFAAVGVDPSRPFNYVCSTPMSHVLHRKIPMARWAPKLGRFPKSERRKAG
jgi:hypothetical protein